MLWYVVIGYLLIGAVMTAALQAMWGNAEHWSRYVVAILLWPAVIYIGATQKPEE